MASPDLDGELRSTADILRGVLDSTTDGILVVEATGRIITYNRRFADMWRLPEEILAAGDDARALEAALGLMTDPDAFMAKIRQLYDEPAAESFDVLALGDPLFSPDDALIEFQNRPSFQGISPVADTHLESFVVLQEPIPDGAMGLGLVTGVTACHVAVEYESDSHAGVIDGVFDRLLGGSDGGARILWKESGEGLKWAVVLVGAVAYLIALPTFFSVLMPLPGGRPAAA